MSKKLKEMAAAEQNALVDAVAGSAQQIWQAGLGAFARAQHEGGELFDSLVREGLDLHQLTQKMAGDKVQGVAERATRLAESVSRQASGSWDKLEKLFEDRVARSMRALGVPSHQDLAALRAELDALKAQVAASASAPAKRNAAAKPADGAKRVPKVVAAKAQVTASPKRQAKAAARHH